MVRLVKTALVMVDWTAVAAIAASLAVAVTLILFTVESRRRAAADRARVRKDATARLLKTMDGSIRRNQGVLSSLRFWAHPDLEYTLAMPRLLHDLGPGDLHISSWSMQQVQQMLAAQSDRQAQQIGLLMAMKVVDWEQGRVPDDWFREELRRVPLAKDFKVPLGARTLRGVDRMKNSFTAVIALTVLGGGLIALGRQLVSVTSGLVEASPARTGSSAK